MLINSMGAGKCGMKKIQSTTHLSETMAVCTHLPLREGGSARHEVQEGKSMYLVIKVLTELCPLFVLLTLNPVPPDL